MRNYKRKIPQSLFSEAILLKGIGEIIKAIDLGLIQNITYKHKNKKSLFLVNFEEDQGTINLDNITFKTSEKNQIIFFLSLDDVDINLPIQFVYVSLGGQVESAGYVWDTKTKLSLQFRSLFS